MTASPVDPVGPEVSPDASPGVSPYVLDDGLAGEYLRFAPFSLDSANDAVFWLTRDGRFCYVNAAACRLTGYSKAELLTLAAWDINRQRSRETWLPHWAELRARGSKVYDTVFRTKDGCDVPVEISANLLEREGEALSCSYVRDVTARKKAEEALRETEERFRLLAEIAPVGIYVTDPDGRSQYVNRHWCDMAGLTPDEARGDGWIRGLAPGERERVAAAWKRMVESGGEWALDYRFQTAAGKVTWVQGRAAPLRDVEGQIKGYVGANADITELKRAEADKLELERQLRHAQKMEAIGTFSGGIAHDFNNILTPILAHAELALLELPEGNSVREDVEAILKAGERAQGLVRQILTISRKEEREPKVFLPAPLVKEALKLLRATLPTTIEIREDVDSRCGAVFADPTQLHQVLLNLCANARDAMGAQGGVLEIGLRRVQEARQEDDRTPESLRGRACLALRVSDSGCGMTPGILERIFEPYFTTKARGEGTGLGLAVIHGIVKGLGGEIDVRSEVDRGTEFQVYLPEHALPPPSAAGTIAAPRGHRERVLFVDDEAMICHVAARMFKSLGYGVTAVGSGAEALELLREDPTGYDLLVSDQTMPHLTGLELLREVAAQWPGLPVILCTGYSGVLDAERARAAGAAALLLKPFTPVTLGTAVAEALARRPQQGNR